MQLYPFGGFKIINIGKWINVILGLVWSIIGTWLLSKFVSMCIKNIISKINVKNIEKMQILSCIRNVVCAWSTRWA